MEQDAPVIVWFRDDLRLDDNPALTAAVQSGLPIVAVYCLDEDSQGMRPLGGAARWWLHHSLDRLTEALARHGATLVLHRGAASACLAALVQQTGARAVFWNRRYGEAERAVDASLKQALTDEGLEVRSFKAGLLFEPWELTTGEGASFRVFSPFWRAALRADEPGQPHPRPDAIKAFDNKDLGDHSRLTDWGLLPTAPDWAGGLRDAWTPGEEGAQRTLSLFVDEAMSGYAAHRDRPDLPATSMLSPHLRFGEISPRRVWHAVRSAASGSARDRDKFLAEIGWREFSYHLLYHFPDLATRNFNDRFDAFPWTEDPDGLARWQRGQTGFPIVDAGLRQLWQTGWMHNRVRMIVASFLIKDLRIPWQQGEDWFWDTLVDADPANNAASWQWVAGSGADAAPYFRVFNPMLQGAKFDPKGDYVRRFVPELSGLDAKAIHAPWEAPEPALRAAGVELGRTYPAPIVDHAEARRSALAAFETIKAAG